jgi:hypothetical protein
VASSSSSSRKWTIDWLWGYFSTPPGELAMTVGAALVTLVAGVVLYRHDRVYTLANEVDGGAEPR